MTRETLINIVERVAAFQRRAENIMDGGENYDGADGARYILELCSICDRLVAAVEETGKGGNAG